MAYIKFYIIYLTIDKMVITSFKQVLTVFSFHKYTVLSAYFKFCSKIFDDKLNDTLIINNKRIIYILFIQCVRIWSNIHKTSFYLHN